MRLEDITLQLEQLTQEDSSSQMDPLPSNFRLKNKIPDNVRHSAVLLLLFEKNGETYSTLTQRHEYKGAHSGQISFPGGKKEASDRDLNHTALRETEEEIGISQHEPKTIHTLKDLYIPPSNFLVTPYVATLDYSPSYSRDDFEVKEIIEFPISRLFEADVIQQKTMHFDSGNSMDVKYFNIQNKVVWGATAMILEDFIGRLRVTSTS